MKSTLLRLFPGLKVSEEIPYREITSLGVGGKLPLLAEPDSEATLSELVKYLRASRTDSFVFGGGTNVVGMDAPFNGIGIRLGEAFGKWERDGQIIRCGAMVRLPVLARAMAEAGLAGLSELVGIPGTVGGAAVMNAGCEGVSFGDSVKSLSGITPEGAHWTLEKDEIHWHYRGNDLPKGLIITEVVLELQTSTPAEEQAKIDSALAKRRAREPEGRSAGCAFRNVSKMEPAGLLIDHCGLRGLAIGDVEVSAKHANYLMNRGSASEADYIEMIRLVRRRVAEKYGFYLNMETVPVNPDFFHRCMDEVPAPRVNVLCGGDSSEREVSLRSGKAIADALRNGGFDVELTDLKRCRLLPCMQESDVVYPALHGGFGEGGELQMLMESAMLKFVGSGSKASRLCMDKIATKRLLDHLGIPTAKWGIVTKENRALPEGLTYPVILKVPCEGSSVGIIKVNSAEEWDAALDSELKSAREILVEEFIEGTEITIPIVNGETLEVVEIRSPQGFYDYDAKYIYKNGHTQYFCPPETVSSDVLAKAKEDSLLFYRASGCRDLLRVDLIIGKDGVGYVLEGNTLPGSTATSLVPKSAQYCGISFEQLTAKLVYAAMKRPKKASLQD